MKLRLLILLNLFVVLISCNIQEEEKSEVSIQREAIIETNDPIEENITQKDEAKNSLTECEKYWSLRFPKDSVKQNYLDRIILKNPNGLTDNNKRFVSALKNQDNSKLAIDNILFPIFRLSEDEIGIFSFPKYKQVDGKFIDISRETALVENFNEINENAINHYKKTVYYQQVLDSLYTNQEKPIIRYYTTSTSKSAQIKDLGIYTGECIEYYQYSFDTTNLSENDKVLFGSTLDIDLVYESNPKIDSLLKNQVKKECLDCPSSSHLEKTFAKLQGTDNLYFIYADTFPLNNELDTPSRGLILLNEHDNIVYLWYDEIDLFGCSCL